MLMAAMKTSLIQRIHKTQASDVVHSSGYVKIQREHGGGPHSGMSYSARTQVDQNRTVVKGYGSSMIMQQGNKMPKAASVGEQGSESDMPVPAYASQKTQENHFGWKSSSDTIASWGYKRDTTIAANTSLNDTADGTTWGYQRKSGDKESLQGGYGRKTGDRESLYQGYGRQSGSRESLNKGYGRMSNADAAGMKTGYANAAAQRQARAARFSGAVSKTNGPAPRPTIGPSFGRHR